MLGLRRRADQPVEQRRFTKPFFVLSVLLVAASAYAIIDEVAVRRPWKEYQREYSKAKLAKLETAYRTSLENFDSTRYRDLISALNGAERAVRGEAYLALREEQKRIVDKLASATRAWQFAKSEADAEAYRDQLRRRDEGETVQGDRHPASLDLAAQRFGMIVDSLQRVIEQIASERLVYEHPADSIRVAISRMETPIKRLRARISAQSEAPVAIRQVLLRDYDVTAFGEPQSRADRCETCHLGARDSMMEDAPEPFTAHPFPELLRLHDPETVACSSCHRGQPFALTESSAHGEEDSNWDTPILRGNDVYAGCSDCHTAELVLAAAPYFGFGRQLFLESGCAGCHTSAQFGDVPKIGPSLRNVRSKETPRWATAWILAPRRYDRFERMPDFRLNVREAEAIVAYLFRTDSLQPTVKPEVPQGGFAGASLSRGRQLFGTIGCEACHSIKQENPIHRARGTSYDFAPSLTRVGSKLSRDWIYFWIKDPTKYDKATRMPNLRLNGSDAKDIAAFLSTMRDSSSVELPALANPTPGLIDSGARLIRKYGCYGCHDIPGMEREPRVSVDLSDFGRKKPEQMDFGNTSPLSNSNKDLDFPKDGSPVHVRRTWSSWVYGKLLNSRLYQTDRIIQRMPVYAFSDTEITALRTVLMSLRSDIPSLPYRIEVTDRIENLRSGQILTESRGCINCHSIEGRGGYVSAGLADPYSGPPPLTIEGSKVQESWLYGFLRQPSSIRPWLHMRMPTFAFSDSEVNTLIRYFLALNNERLQIKDYEASTAGLTLTGPGHQLYTLFQCARCHSAVTAHIDTRTVGPDLRLANRRLKPGWIAEWLKDPQTIQAGTMMPSYFPEGETPAPNILRGSSRLQIEAIRDYVFSLGERKP